MGEDDFYRGDPPGGGAPAAGPVGYGPTPGYGAAGYGRPPGYGAPPGYGPAPGWPQGAGRRPTNATAVLALVLAFVFGPAGLVVGLVARRQIRQSGEGGEGLALAGIILGGIVTALYVLGILLVIVGLTAAGTSYVSP